ncbi:Arrestin [Portunus trituberculatus]|uniref:Arrestin n=1 Tax=Portunus trituberculatus TaxID=210409 RepID=A0A5B7D2Z1_PORTR|nr:Arrestin [Portunus trituberculatus]
MILADKRCITHECSSFSHLYLVSGRPLRVAGNQQVTFNETFAHQDDTVFKKTAPNGKITLYVEQRELCIGENGIQPLQGILYVDANYVKDRKVFGQFVLTFRYGREDEEGGVE